MADIVIDANVFGHSNNPDVPRFSSALGVVSWLLDSDVNLALDDTGKAAPDQVTSNLFREYSEAVPPTSFARVVINEMFNRGRVRFHPRPSRQDWKACCALIPRNQHDAIVLGIAVCTDLHTLVTNDFDDFDEATRRKAKKLLAVLIRDSDEHLADVS